MYRFVGGAVWLIGVFVARDPGLGDGDGEVGGCLMYGRGHTSFVEDGADFSGTQMDQWYGIEWQGVLQRLRIGSRGRGPGARYGDHCGRFDDDALSKGRLKRF